MNPAQKIIARFGSQQKLADALGTAQTTISGWALRGRIPSTRQAAVLSAAWERGIELQPADFFDLPRDK